ncbi:type II CAAX endopeptidase family protein [Sporosarcina sp. FSL K6-2383]|uniref:CPBP family intramembrane glutamic endopeptidase n=1 Tax=Sporosarcina sp. FSL K6-2383 TaxID=2921556 RepID=UPI003159B812
MKKTNTHDNGVYSGRRTSKFMSFLQFPLIWMFVGALGIALINLAYLLISKDSNALVSIVIAIVGCGVAIIFYWLVMKFLARRQVTELLHQRPVSEIMFGGVVAFIFIVISAVIVVLFDGYSFTWEAGNVSSIVLPIITASLGAAVIEELIFRGLFFQAIEKMAGSWIALALTSIFFGIVHLGNPGATIWGAFSISVEAGVLLGAAFLWRRNIWFVIGLHFFWNTIQGLLGIPVSGHPSTGLFTLEVAGPALLTGGEFGLEASIVTVIMGLLIAIPMLILARRKGNFVSRRQDPK